MGASGRKTPNLMRRAPAGVAIALGIALALPASGHGATTRQLNGTIQEVTSDGSSPASGFALGDYVTPASGSVWPGTPTFVFGVNSKPDDDFDNSDLDGTPVTEPCQGVGFSARCRASAYTGIVLTGGIGSDVIQATTADGGPSVSVTANLGDGADIASLAGRGTRSVNGGNGSDTFEPVHVDNGTTPVAPAQNWDIDLQAQTASSNASDPIALQGFENVDFHQPGHVSTTAGNDVGGNDQPNTIKTDNEDVPDTVDGRGDADTIETRGGDDTITGGPGADVIDCGPGNDTVTDAAPEDTLTNCETDESGIVVNDDGDDADADTTDESCDTDATEKGPQCTLRAAIEEANAQTGAQDVAFNIQPGGVATVQIGAALPAVTETVTIDGGSQPGTPEGEPGVFISGAELTASRQRGEQAPVKRKRVMLSLSSGNGSVLQQLGFNNAPATALAIKLNAQMTTLAQVRFGVAEQLTELAKNGQDGISIEGDDTTVRDSVISGNGRYGVHVEGAKRTQLLRNLFGTLKEGVTSHQPVANDEAGLAITDGATNTSVVGNTLGRNRVGILLEGLGAGTVISSNEIGATHEGGAGAELISNEEEGIRVLDTNLKAGEEAEISENTIANNGAVGISFSKSGGFQITENAVGVSLGLGGQCAASLPNIDAQMIAKGEPKASAAGLTIRGNRFCEPLGVPVNLADQTGAQLSVNYIEGALVLKNVRGEVIENTISDSASAGIALKAQSEVNVTRNVMSEIAGRMIELDREGAAIDEPDPLDLDKGPNGLQNYPYISFAVASSPTELTTSHGLLSAPNAEYRIDYYGGNQCLQDQVAAAGGVYLYSEQVVTDQNGYAYSGLHTSSVGVAGYSYLSQTATRTDTEWPATSELSQCVPVLAPSSRGLGITPESLEYRDGVATLVDCFGATACDTTVNVIDRRSGKVLGSGEETILPGATASIDVETKKLERMVEKREELFVELQAIMGGYDTSAKAVIYEAKRAR